MRSHSRSHLPLFLALAGAAALVAAGCSELAVDQEARQASALHWPNGDAQKGMQAFKDLKCTACHRVESIPELAALNEEPIGPALDGQGVERTRMGIMVQIVAPGTDPSIRESHMGNFDETMTVAQLTDLIAFVESIQPPPAGVDAGAGAEERDRPGAPTRG